MFYITFRFLLFYGATDCWMQYASDSNHEKKMFAQGSLICHSNSYPFENRNLGFEKPIKIGRSVARAKANTNNAIFDCKVLSRNHAIIWHDSGKFYLKDTKSSNGTFINNKRLSSSGEESAKHEIYSGDIVQFGVDVVDNSSNAKVTHGCIVAILKLYLANGKEAKENCSNSDTYINITFEDLHKLNQFIQEAGRRESALRTKLEHMQILLEQTKIAAIQSWKALVLEDCLLSRLEILESQVIAYSKNFGEDKLRIEVINLLEDKVIYQNASKELLQKKVQEISKSFGKVQILKCRLSETEEEMQSLHHIIKDNQNELNELTIKYIKLQQALQATNDKYNKAESELQEVLLQSEKDKKEFLNSFEDQKKIEMYLRKNIKELISNKLNIQKQIIALRNYMQIIQNIKNDKNACFDKDCLSSINIIDDILNKWKYMFLDVVNYEILIDKLEQENHINSIEHQSINQFNESCTNDNSVNNTTLEFNKNQYILSHITDSTKLEYVLNSKDLINEPKNKFVATDFENSFIVDCENICDPQKENTKILVSTIDKNKNVGDDKNKITPVKLMLKFSSEHYNVLYKILKNNCYDLEVNSLDFRNISNNFLSKQILKNIQKRNNVIEFNNELFLNQTKLKQLYLSEDFATNILKSLIVNNIIFNTNSQDLIVHNFIHLLNSLKLNHHNINYHIMQEIQNIKKWFIYESNIIFLKKLRNYEVRSENLQVQELSEQLVILKEKYNATFDEKANIIKKYMSLKVQYKDFINTTYMVPIYYVVPIIFALICMILEKIL